MTKEFGLQDYLRILQVRWPLVLLVIGSVVGLAAAYTFTRTPLYAASTDLLIESGSSAASSVVNPSAGAYIDQYRLTQTELSFATSSSVGKRVVDQLDAIGSISGSTADNSNVITLTATSDSARVAADTANAYAEAYVEVRRQQTIEDFTNTAATLRQAIADLDERLDDTSLEPSERNALESQRALYVSTQEQLSIGADLYGQVRPRIISEALPPSTPYTPRPVRNLVVAGLAGFVLAAGAALLRDALDLRVRTKEDQAAATGGLAVLAEIPANSSWRRKPSGIVTLGDANGRGMVESYRSLATAVRFVVAVGDRRVLVVTSPVQGEGKTTTVGNLAVALAAQGLRVVAVDADLRKPRLTELFETANHLGLSDVLAGRAELTEVLHRPSPDLPLVVVGAGTMAPNPAELLASPACGALFAQLAEAADIVVVDSPPVLPVADPRALADKVDGYILLSRVEGSTSKELTDAVTLLRQVDATLVGTVLTCVEPSKLSYGYGGYGEPNERTKGGQDNTRATFSAADEANLPRLFDDQAAPPRLRAAGSNDNVADLGRKARSNAP